MLLFDGPESVDVVPLMSPLMLAHAKLLIPGCKAEWLGHPNSFPPQDLLRPRVLPERRNGVSSGKSFLVRIFAEIADAIDNENSMCCRLSAITIHAAVG